MPNPSPDRKPDPMAGVVDRLLAQLPGLQGEPHRPVNTSRQTNVVIASRSQPERDLLGPWARLLLGLALGTMIVWWPYSKSCGFPLVGYLGAIVTIILSGGWAAVASWRYRARLAHIISLILMFYGAMLGAAELLPRTGYAVDHATWGCHEVSSYMAWQVMGVGPVGRHVTGGTEPHS